MRHQEAPLETAVRRAVALRDRVLCRFLALRREVLPQAGRELRRYLTDLGHGIRGNAERGLLAPRYLIQEQAGGGDEVARLPDAVWADEPLDAAGAPAAPPSVSWWWDDLAIAARHRRPSLPGAR